MERIKCQAKPPGFKKLCLRVSHVILSAERKEFRTHNHFTLHQFNYCSGLLS